MTTSPMKFNALFSRLTRCLVAVLTCVLLAASCGVDEDSAGQGALVVPTSSADETSTPAETDELSIGETNPDPTVDTSPTAAPAPSATSAAVEGPTSPVPTSEAAAPSPTVPSPPFATATPRAQSTTTPQPTASPQPTVRTQPTAAPRPTAVPVPSATPTPTVVSGKPQVTCSVSKRTVAVREALAFEASSSPASIPVTFVFDHGDGTLDPGQRSDAFYTRNGQYRVRLQWMTDSHDGVVECQSIKVLDANGCHIGLGPADGLGWWCGGNWCASNSLQPVAGCPNVPPHGCYVGMDGKPYCVDEVSPVPTATPGPELQVWCSISPDGVVQVNQALVFQAFTNLADAPINFAFDHGDGTVDPGARSDAFYLAPGFYPVQLQWSALGRSGVVDCGTVEVVPRETQTFVLTCTISDTQVLVNEQTVFRWSTSVPVDDLSVTFLHGDGTRDSRNVATAVYLAPGVYTVSLEWQTPDAFGTAPCGTVTVT